MAIVHLENVEKDRWYNITVSDMGVKDNPKGTFEAKFDGEFWRDYDQNKFSVYTVTFIDDELAF